MSNTSENAASTYEDMADAVKASVDQLLIPFQAASEPKSSVREITTEEFFQKFLVYADKFAGQCCQDFSKILRHSSIVPEVRGTPTLHLAKQVRETAFEAADRILVSYVESLKQLNVDLNTISGSITDTSVVGQALKGAALGRVAGGFGGTGKILGAVGAVVAAGTEAMKQAALLQQQKQLEAQAKSLAFSKILEYLKAAKALPENLLDYGCAKCFGGQVDFAKQNQALERIRSATLVKLEEAINFTLQLQEDETQRVSQAVIAEAAERQEKSEASDSQASIGCGGLSLIIGGIVTAITGANILDPTNASSGESLGIGIAIGVSMVVVGIIYLAKGLKGRNARKRVQKGATHQLRR